MAQQLTEKAQLSILALNLLRPPPRMISMTSLLDYIAMAN